MNINIPVRFYFGKKNPFLQPMRFCRQMNLVKHLNISQFYFNYEKKKYIYIFNDETSFFPLIGRIYEATDFFVAPSFPLKKKKKIIVRHCLHLITQKYM